MVAAYLYAESSDLPPGELILASYIDRWGVQATLNRTYLGYGEMQRILTAERIVAAYRGREKATNWVEWAKEYPLEHELLAECARLTERGYADGECS